MANCVKCRFSLNLQLFSVVLKSAPVKYIVTYCHWDSHQIHSSCASMSLWWQNNPSLWLSWTVSVPKWVSILWHAACAQSDAKLLEGGVHHGTCTMHVPLCMSESLTCGGGENAPVSSGVCAICNFTYLVRGPCMQCVLMWPPETAKILLVKLSRMTKIFIDIVQWVQNIEAETKLPSFSRRHFQMHFLKWKCTKF